MREKLRPEDYLMIGVMAKEEWPDISPEARFWIIRDTRVRGFPILSEIQGEKYDPDDDAPFEVEEIRTGTYVVDQYKFFFGYGPLSQTFVCCSYKIAVS